MTEQRENYHIRAVDRVLSLLDVFFEKDSSEMSIGELARRVKIHKSTVHRMVVTLVDRGYLEQNKTSGKYRLGIRLFQLGTQVHQRMELRSEVRPFLSQLVQETSESAYLSVLSGINRVCIDKVDCEQTIRHVIEVGTSLPIYAGAAGKVLLANLGQSDQELLLQSFKLDKLCANTIVNKDELRAELETIRAQGYGMSQNERMPDSFGVAAPIFDVTGECIAVISVAGPNTRFTGDNVLKIVRSVLYAANAASQRLGYSANLNYSSSQVVPR